MVSDMMSLAIPILAAMKPTLSCLCYDGCYTRPIPERVVAL